MKRETINGTWTAGLLALGCAGLELLLFLFVPAVRGGFQKLGNENMVFYGVFLLSFALVFLAANALLKNRKFSLPQKPAVKWTAAGIGLFFGIWFLTKLLLNEEKSMGTVLFLGLVETFLWQRVPILIDILAVAVAAAVLLWFWRKEERQRGTLLYYGIYLLVSAAAGYSLYMPNDLQADPLHGHAYYTSIYSVVHGRAFDDLFTSIYGHYALFFRWPLKILGNGNIREAVALTALIGGVSVFLALWAMHQYVKSSRGRILGALSIGLPVIALRLENYWQVQPLRVVFTCLFLFYGALYNKKKFRGGRIVGYALAMLAIVWNTETGVVCAISWAAFSCYQYLEREDWKSLRTLLFVAGQLLAAGASFAGAVVTVNLYNLIHGGTWNSVETFLYPLLKEDYMTGYLRTDLPDFVSAYMLVLALFLGGMVWSLAGHRFFRGEPGKTREIHSFVFLASVLGLGQITYYMNRAEYFNLDLIHVPVTVLLCVFLDQSLPGWRGFLAKQGRKAGWRELGKGVAAILLTLVLTAVSLGTMVQGAYQAQKRQELGYRDMDSAYEFLALLQQDLPINTFAFGQGVPELYGLMGWDTRCHVIDFSDRTELALQYVRDSLEQEEYFFAFLQDAEFILEENPGVWYPYKQYEYAGDVYVYFRRNP